MTTLFDFLSFSPGLFWILILFFPRHPKAMLAVDAFLFLLSGIYVFIVLPEVPALLPIIAKPTLEAIRQIFSAPRGTVGAWNHMILADLWIGRWVARDSLDDTYAPWIRAVFIPPILFFGPLGLFCYLIYRMAVRGRFALT